MEKVYYSYEDFTRDTRVLIQKQQSFAPEVIVGIARGGLTLAHAMAEGCNIRNVQTLRTELYDKSCKRENITLFGSCEFEEGARVLLVDDIADSGETLLCITEYLKKHFPTIDLRVATLFYKRSSLFEPDYWVNEADAWIEFFWEKDFS